MTKEQKEAIEYLNYMEKHIGFNRIGYVYGNDVIKNILSMLEEKEKVIDLMAKRLVGDIFSNDIELENIFNNKEDVKQYFENKVRQESDKDTTGK